ELRSDSSFAYITSGGLTGASPGNGQSLQIESDIDVYLKANRTSSAVTVRLNTSGNFFPGVTDTQSLGTSGNRFLTGYIDVLNPNINAPGQITGNQNNYNPGNAFYIQAWTTDASRNVTGMTVNTSTDGGRIMLICNVGSFNLVLQHLNAGSSGNNQFSCSTGADITLTPGQAADVWYDTNAAFNKWRVFKRN